MNWWKKLDQTGTVKPVIWLVGGVWRTPIPRNWAAEPSGHSPTYAEVYLDLVEPRCKIKIINKINNWIYLSISKTERIYRCLHSPDDFINNFMAKIEFCIRIPHYYSVSMIQFLPNFSWSVVTSIYNFRVLSFISEMDYSCVMKCCFQQIYSCWSPNHLWHEL